MIWGAIFWNGPESLYFVEGTVDSEYYCHIMDECLPDIEGIMSRKRIFMQDGTRCHTSRRTLEHLEGKNINIIEWSP